MRITKRNGKIYIGEYIPYFGHHNLIIRNNEFFTIPPVDTKDSHVRAGEYDVYFIKGNAIICKGDECNIFECDCPFKKKHLPALLEILRRAKKIDHEKDWYFDNETIYIIMNDSFMTLDITKKTPVLSLNHLDVTPEEIIEYGTGAFLVKKFGNIGGFEAVSYDTVKNDRITIKYNDWENALVLFNDGVSLTAVRVPAMPPDEIDKIVTGGLFDIPLDKKEHVLKIFIRENAPTIDAVPMNGKFYSVNGVIVSMYSTSDWRSKRDNVIYEKEWDDLHVEIERDGYIIHLTNPTVDEIEKWKNREIKIADVPAEVIIYNVNNDTVYYKNVKISNKKYSFRSWNGRFFMSGVVYSDGVYDVVTRDWRDFFKNSVDEAESLIGVRKLLDLVVKDYQLIESHEHYYKILLNNGVVYTDSK